MALRAAANNPREIDSVVLAATGCRTGRVKLSWAAHDIIANFFCLGHQIDVTRYQLRYGTEDTVALRESFLDGWQRSTMSARELLRAAQLVRRNPKVAKHVSANTSFLVLQGRDDMVLKTKSARKVVAAIPSMDKKYV